MNGVTNELIELQTICLSFGESLIDNDGHYKKVFYALETLSRVWERADEKTQKMILKLMGF